MLIQIYPNEPNRLAHRHSLTLSPLFPAHTDASVVSVITAQFTRVHGHPWSCQDLVPVPQKSPILFHPLRPVECRA